VSVRREIVMKGRAAESERKKKDFIGRELLNIRFNDLSWLLFRV